ncbi:MAG TPA: hypothetical protein VFZ66_27585 [Herpetosiphonaceae bacterium]
MSLPPIPPQMTDLPRSGDLPVPFTVLWMDDKPDFRVSNPARVLECYARRRCGICGRPLDYWIAFVGGPLSIANRLFFDAAMHAACARFALAVCPFLAFRNAGYSSRPIPAGAAYDPAIGAERPEIFGLLETWTYTVVKHRGGIYARAAKPRTITWFNHAGEFGVGLAPPPWRDVVLLLDDRDSHGVGHDCGLCNAQGISYGVRIADAARVRYEAPDDIEMGSLDDAHLVRIYGPSEPSALDRARAYCAAHGWRIRE